MLKLSKAILFLAMCALLAFNINVCAQPNFISDFEIFKSRQFQHQNADQYGRKAVSTGPGYMSWGVEQTVYLEAGDTVISIPLVEKPNNINGDIMRTQIVVRDHSNNAVLAVASRTYNSSAFNNPSNTKHFMPVSYRVFRNGWYRMEHRIEALVSGLSHRRTLAVIGNDIDVHISNGHSTTLSRSFGQTGSVAVSALLPSGKPANKIRTWRKTAGHNYGQQYFDGIAKMDVDGWAAYDSKLRADNEDDKPTAFIVKENLSYDWKDILNDAKQVLNYVQQAWDWVQIVPLLI